MSALTVVGEPVPPSLPTSASCDRRPEPTENRRTWLPSPKEKCTLTIMITCLSRLRSDIALMFEKIAVLILEWGSRVNSLGLKAVLCNRGGQILWPVPASRLVIRQSPCLQNLHVHHLLTNVLAIVRSQPHAMRYQEPAHGSRALPVVVQYADMYAKIFEEYGLV